MYTSKCLSCTYDPARGKWRLRPAGSNFFPRETLSQRNIAIIGYPAAGKSTLARELRQNGARVFAASQIVKAFIHGKKTPPLRLENLPENPAQLKSLLEKLRREGKLWPTPVSATLIFEKLKKAGTGWVLEGFPRSADAANLLLENFKLDCVFFLEIPEEVAVSRALARGGDTDTPEAIKNKIKISKEEEKALTEVFNERNLLVRINAASSEEATLRQAAEGLKALSSPARVVSHLAAAKPLTHMMVTADIKGMSPELIRKIIRAGANTFRFNFSFITTPEQRKSAEELLETIRQIAAEEKQLVGCAADLSGSSKRIGRLPGPMILQKDDAVKLVQSEFSDSEGAVPISISDPDTNLIESAAAALNKNGRPRVLIDHAQIILEIERIEGGSLVARVIKGGILKAGKSLSFPQMELKIKSLTGTDEENLKFALKLNFDYVVQSFVSTAEDVSHLRRLMRDLGKTIPVIAKIETREALREENLSGIARAADALMVARGHLADETGARHLVPIAQDRIDYYARLWGKPIILATEVYSSMMKDVLPNRADADNVYRAIRDSVDMIMLSGAEAILTPHPVLVMETIVEQALATESSLEKNEMFRLMRERRRFWFTDHLSRQVLPQIPDPVHQDEARKLSVFSRVAVNYAESENIRAIAVATDDRRIPFYLSRLIPHLKILVVTSRAELAKELLLYGGVYPVLVEKLDDLSDFTSSLNGLITRYNLLQKGEKGILIAGNPLGNRVKIEVVQ